MALAELTLDAAGIATITLNRPEVLNALDVPTARALHDAVMAATGDEATRCIVLRGAGRAFMAGGDLAAFARDFDTCADVIDDLLDALNPAIIALATHPAPVLASVHGAVAGAGLSLVAGCDLVIAADDSRFLIAYDRIGAPPDCGGSWYLPRRVGYARAAELMLLGASWDAASAERHGLVNQVVPAATLATATDALARRLAAGPTHAYGQYKQLAAQAFSRPLAEHLEAERAAFRQATASADFRTGVTAFLARTTPVWQGR